MSQYRVGLFSLFSTLLVVQEAICMNYSSKTPYAELFTPEQFEYINNPDNYKVENCV